MPERFIRVVDLDFPLCDVDIVFYLLTKVGMNLKERRFVSGVKKYYKRKNWISVGQLKGLIGILCKWKFVIQNSMMNWLNNDYNYEGQALEIERFWKWIYGDKGFGSLSAELRSHS